MGNFKNMLKQLRKAKGLTQGELAKTLKLSRSAIGMYENGSREPDYEILEMIADYFNVDIDYLLGRTDKTTVLPESFYIEAPDNSYYLDKDAKEAAQFLFENPEYKVLFDATRQVKKEDIDFVKQMIDRVRGDSSIIDFN